METTVLLDGRAVRFKATAAIPRLYRVRFRRDIMRDMTLVARALEDKAQSGENIPPLALEMFENMAYLMAHHADPQNTPPTPEEWMEGFATLSIYQVFPVIQALWEGNGESLAEAKKKQPPSTGS